MLCILAKSDGSYLQLHLDNLLVFFFFYCMYAIVSECDYYICTHIYIYSFDIVAFSETLPDEHKHMSEAELLEHYLKPFFTDRSIYLYIGARFQIHEVDFKIRVAYPPAGITTNQTMVTRTYICY